MFLVGGGAKWNPGSIQESVGGGHSSGDQQSHLGKWSDSKQSSVVRGFGPRLRLGEEVGGQEFYNQELRKTSTSHTCKISLCLMFSGRFQSWPHN